MKSFPVPQRTRLVRPCFHLPAMNQRAGLVRRPGARPKQVVVHYDASEIRRADWEISGAENALNVWRDLGPNRLDLYGTSSWRPDYRENVKTGLPVVRFDSTASMFRTGIPIGAFGGTLGGSVTAVMRHWQNFTSNAPLLTCDWGGLTARTRWGFGSSTSGDQMTVGNGTAGSVSMARTQHSSWTVVTMQRDNYVCTVWECGKPVAYNTQFTTAPVQTAGVGTLLMGYVLTGSPGGSGFNGDVGEVMTHAEPLSPDEIQTLHARLMEKWGIGTARRRERIVAPGMVMGYDACDLALVHGAAVTNWPSSIGQATHALDTVKATGPTFKDNNPDGMPGVNFSGGGLYTSASIDPIASSPDMAIYIVYTPGVQTVTFTALMSHGANTAPGSNWLFSIRNGTSEILYYAHADAPGGTYRNFSGGGTRKGGRQLAWMNKSGVNGLCGNDINQSGSTASLHATMTTNAKPMHVGVKDQNNEAFVGQIHEIIVCNAAHTADQRADIQRALARKWGFSPY